MANKENEVKNTNISALGKDARKDSDISLTRKVNFLRESISDSGVPQRKPSSAVDTTKRSSLCSQDLESESSNTDDNTKVPRKFISTWRQACDRTKDKTKELLKRWKTLPEGNTEMMIQTSIPSDDKPLNSESSHNWSVHVWASYITRCPSEEENLLLSGSDKSKVPSYSLSPVQKEKLGHYFSQVLDNDHDDLISEQDFEHFFERLRRFADWSTNSPEFFIMAQVQHGFLSTFLADNSSNKEEELIKFKHWKQYIGLEEWFQCWAYLCQGAHNLNDFPVWLQYFPKLLFQTINRSGCGSITKDELSSFYSSVLGFMTQQVGEILDTAYTALTSNGDHSITYDVYRLAFTNFLLGKHPNGPGQYLFCYVSSSNSPFPIDYSALNSQPEDREHYTPDKKSNRVSVIV